MDTAQRRAVREHLVLAAFAVAVTWAAVHFSRLFFSHAPHAEYLIPAYAKGVVGAVLLAMLVATAGGFLARRGIATTLAALAILLLFYGLLFTLLGLPLVALGVVAAVGAARALRGATRERATIAAGGGVMIGLGLAFVIMVGRHPPLVDCRDNSTTVTSWFWGGSPSRSSSAGSSATADAHRGTVSFDGEKYQFLCRDRMLVSFQRAR